MRLVVATLVAVIAFVECGRAMSDDLVSSWYPLLHIGNTWVYADESRDADNEVHGIANPTIGRWTTTETVAAVVTIPEGMHVTIRSTIRDLARIAGWHQDPALLTPPLTDWLVRGQCVYRLDTATTARSEPDDIWTAYDANHRMRPEFRVSASSNSSSSITAPMTSTAAS